MPAAPSMDPLLRMLGSSMVWDTAARSQIPNSTLNRTDPRFQSYSSNRQIPIPQYYQTGVSARQYTYDRLFYQRPTLSPYLTLSRPNYLNKTYPSVKFVHGNDSGVKPAIARQRPTNSITGGSQRVGATSAYYNQWYDQRRAMGLAR